MESAPQKSQYVRDLTISSEVADIFLLTSAQQGQARNGPYWRLEFRDASGNISGKIWSPQSQAYPDLAAGSFMWVTGRITSYKDKLELAIDSLTLLTPPQIAALDLNDFIPASAQHPDKMLEELVFLTKKTLHHKPWRKLILSLLHDEAIVAALRLAPAAKGMHHAYAGGLLEHTLSVCQLCLRIATHYPHLDRQALFAGAVCHDLGKIWELTSGITVDYTTSGRLIGHISLLLEHIAPFIKKSGLEPELAEHLQHLILSHHGTLEFGSPKLPATAEAIILHYADNIDAKLQQVASALDGLEEGKWSTYMPSLERFLFRAPHTPEPPAPDRKPAPEQGPNAPAQATPQLLPLLT